MEDGMEHQETLMECLIRCVMDASAGALAYELAEGPAKDLAARAVAAYEKNTNPSIPSKDLSVLLKSCVRQSREESGRLVVQSFLLALGDEGLDGIGVIWGLGGELCNSNSQEAKGLVPHAVKALGRSVKECHGNLLRETLLHIAVCKGIEARGAECGEVRGESALLEGLAKAPIPMPKKRKRPEKAKVSDDDDDDSSEEEEEEPEQDKKRRAGNMLGRIASVALEGQCHRALAAVFQVVKGKVELCRRVWEELERDHVDFAGLAGDGGLLGASSLLPSLPRGAGRIRVGIAMRRPLLICAGPLPLLNCAGPLPGDLALALPAFAVQLFPSSPPPSPVPPPPVPLLFQSPSSAPFSLPPFPPPLPPSSPSSLPPASSSPPPPSSTMLQTYVPRACSPLLLSSSHRRALPHRRFCVASLLKSISPPLPPSSRLAQVVQKWLGQPGSLLLVSDTACVASLLRICVLWPSPPGTDVDSGENESHHGSSGAADSRRGRREEKQEEQLGLELHAAMLQALGVGREKGRKCVAAKAVQALAGEVAALESSSRRAAANRLAQGLLALWLNGWMDGEGKQIAEALAAVQADTPLMGVLIGRLS